MSDWDRLLDEMEIRVVMAERYLAGDDVELDPFEEPFGLGTLPARYADRARRLLDATVEVERRLAEERDRVRTRLFRSGGSAALHPEPPEPVYFDRSA